MTIQTPDTLLLDGQQYRIPDILLDGCAEPALQRLLKRLPPRRLRMSATRRGYWCTWELRSDVLWLVDFYVVLGGGRPGVHYREVLTHAPQGIAATWVSGQIDVPIGEPIHIYADIWTSAESLLLEVVNGKVISRVRRDNREQAARDIQRWADTTEKANRAVAAEKERQRLNPQPDPADLLDDESEVEAQAWEYLLLAMSGELDSATRANWASFHEAHREQATDRERVAMDLVNNALNPGQRR